MAMAQVGGKRLIVLGGGLSGLCYVHYLRNFLAACGSPNGLIGRVTLVEGNDYMGGSIKTQMFDDRIVHELGPRSIRFAGVKGKNTALLVEQLGLQDKVLSITEKSSAGQDRYIYDNEQLFRVPTPPKFFSRFPNSKKTLMSAIVQDLFKAKKMDLSQYPDQDPPIYDFVAHRFGPDVAERVADPVLRGITAGDARKISTKAMINDFLSKEQVYGSVIKGFIKPPVTKMAHDKLFPNDVLKSELLDRLGKDRTISYNLSSGLQTLTEHLSNSLLNTNDDALLAIYNSTRVQSISFNDNPNDKDTAPCSIVVKTIDGDLIRIDGDHIISAIPACDLAKILPEDMPEEQKSALSNVTAIKHAPVGCCVVEYRNLGKLPNVVNSFGFLTNSNAGSRVLGISFDSTMFPTIDEPHKSVRMTCMIGGAWWREMFQTDNLNSITDGQIEQISLEEIRKILKIEAEPHRMTPLLWKTGIAQYTPGHMDRLQQTRDEIKRLGLPLTLIGQSYDGIAINDVTFSARMAAYDFVNSLNGL